MNRLAETGAELLGETLAGIEHIELKPQTNADATYAPMLTREDGLIDWTMNAVAVERRVRGFSTLA